MAYEVQQIPVTNNTNRLLRVWSHLSSSRPTNPDTQITDGIYSLLSQHQAGRSFFLGEHIKKPMQEYSPVAGMARLLCQGRNQTYSSQYYLNYASQKTLEATAKLLQLLGYTPNRSELFDAIVPLAIDLKMALMDGNKLYRRECSEGRLSLAKVPYLFP